MKLDYLPPASRQPNPWLRDAALYGSVSALLLQLLGILIYWWQLPGLRQAQLSITGAAMLVGAVTLVAALVALAMSPRGRREIVAVSAGVLHGGLLIWAIARFG
jgi:hypothetical protein